MSGKFAEIVSPGEWLSLSVLLPVNSGRCSYKNRIVRQFHAYLLCTMRMKRPYAFKHRLNGIWSFNKGWLWKSGRDDTPVLNWKLVLQFWFIVITECTLFNFCNYELSLVVLSCSLISLLRTLIMWIIVNKMKYIKFLYIYLSGKILVITGVKNKKTP